MTDSPTDGLEEALVASVVLNGAPAFAKLSPVVHHTDFEQPNTKLLWSLFEYLGRKGELTDSESVLVGMFSVNADMLGQYPPVRVIQYVGGNDCTKHEAPERMVLAYAHAIKKKSQQRQLETMLDAAASMAKLPNPDIDEILALTKSIQNIHSNQEQGETLLDIWNEEPPSSETNGVSWGLPGLDVKCPLAQGRFAVLAAPPGTGKTLLATQCALATAQNEAGVAFLSMEMSSVDLKERIKKRIPEPQEWMGKLSFPNRRDITSANIGQHIERCAHQGAKLVIIDYIQRVPGTEGQDEISKINDVSRACADAATRCGIAVLGLSQLNREATKTKSEGKPKRPSMADLKGSSCLEQDADYVFFIWDEHNTRNTSQPGEAREMTLVTAKNRHGDDCRDRPITLMGTHFIQGSVAIEKSTRYTEPPSDDENAFM